MKGPSSRSFVVREPDSKSEVGILLPWMNSCGLAADESITRVYVSRIFSWTSAGACPMRLYNSVRDTSPEVQIRL